MSCVDCLLSTQRLVGERRGAKYITCQVKRGTTVIKKVITPQRGRGDTIIPLENLRKTFVFCRSTVIKHYTTQVPTTQLALMAIEPKFVELTADALITIL